MANTVALSPLLTKREVADLLRCSERTLDRLRERGVIEPVRWSRRRVLFPRSEVKRLLDAPDAPPSPHPVDPRELDWR